MGFMEKVFAFERQCMADRRISKQTLRSLKAIARDGVSAGNPATSLKRGTYLMREWNGRSYQVEVVSGGFVMDGKTFSSLSAIAKHITGAHWSGPTALRGVIMKKKIRCAIYTRKSSEEGLDQDFNSLDAQREAWVA